MPIVTELFNIAANDFDAKKFACYSWMLIVTKLVVSGTQCTLNESEGQGKFFSRTFVAA